MGNYYNRDGTPITGTQEEVMRKVASFYADDRDMRRVAQDTIGGLYVSTVFLALDHNHGEGPPLIFETMVFGPKETEDGVEQHTDLDCRRYSTEVEALEGHHEVVQDILRGTLHGYDLVDTSYVIEEIPTLD